MMGDTLYYNISVMESNPIDSGARRKKNSEKAREQFAGNRL
jgi:hypothetical protein